MCVCHLLELLQDAFYRYTSMIVPWVQPPGQGMWALRLGMYALGFVYPRGIQGPDSRNPALRSSWLSALPLPFYRTSVVVLPGGSLNLTSFAGSREFRGRLLAPLQASNSRAADPFVCLHVCGAGPGCQGGRRPVCLSGLSCQTVCRKGDKADGPGEGLVLGTLLADVEPWAVSPGCHVEAPPPWAWGSAGPSWAVNGSSPCSRSPLGPSRIGMQPLPP